MFTRIRQGVGGFSNILSSPLPIESYLGLISPLRSSTSIPARIQGVILETPRAATVMLKAGPRWRGHRAGQWVGVGVDINGVRHRRSYSITSVPSPQSGLISITVQATPGGLVSNHLVRDAQVGDTLYLEPASGDFVLPDSCQDPVLFITAGSGITPVMGILRTMAATNGIGDVFLIHHAPDPTESIFSRELSEMARRFSRFRYVEVFTRFPSRSGGNHISETRLDEMCPDWTKRSTWACGPTSLLCALTQAWETRVQDRPLNLERFTLARTENLEVQGGRVRFTKSAIEAVSDGRSPLLHVAESAGLIPPSGCRMGICHTCDSRLVSGTVRDLRDGRTQCDPGDRVQICVSVAAGDVELEV